jgi:DNA-binding transcriptional LysR family regulator
MLLTFARRLLALNPEAVSKFILPDISGIVRLGSPDDFGERVLPSVLKRFAQSHPAIAVDVVIDQSVNLRKRMAARQLDITIMTCAEDLELAGVEFAALAFVWIVLAVVIWRWHRRRPLPTLLVPFVGAGVLWGALRFGERVLGWGA